MSTFIDLNQLQTFVSIAHYGSITDAAKYLHITQPAATKRLQQLESQLGKRLFDRVQKRLLLTQEGTLLLTKAQEILDRAQDMQRYASTLDKQIAGSLSIATSHHVGLRRLPSALKAFRRSFPDVELDVSFVASEVAIDYLLQGKIELAFITLPTNTLNHIDTKLLWHDPLHIVASNDNPLARLSESQRKINIKTLLSHPAVLPDQNTHTYQLVAAAITDQLNADQLSESNIQIAMTNNAMETIKLLTSCGFGWSALPATMLDDTLTRIAINLPITRQLGIAWHSNRTLSNAARALQSIVEKPL